VRRQRNGKSGAGSTATSDSDAQNEFNFGYFYRTLEEHVNAFAEQEGCPYTLTDIALRVGQLLEAKALRQQSGSAQLVPQMRQNGGGAGRRDQGDESGVHDDFASAEIHVRPRHRRALSGRARKAIGEAQRRRWAKFHKAQDLPIKKRRAKRSKRGSRAASAFWATMTAAQRSVEMRRRQAVAAKKKAARLAA
jgi:hypothetical protein